MGGLRSRALLVCVGVLALCCVAVLPAAAAPGDLDPTFGTGGTVQTSFLDVAQAHYFAIQPTDGKIVVSGMAYSTTTPGSDGAIARYNADGTLDSGFGTGGKLLLPQYNESSLNNRLVAVQGDGKLLVAGCIYDSNGSRDHLVVTRLLANGSVDTSYGTNGAASADVGVYYCYPHGLQVQSSDGKLVVLTKARINIPQVGQPDAFALTRFNTDGTVDTGFGTGGNAYAVFGDPSSITTLRPGYPNDMVIQSDGKIVVAGEALPTNFGNPISMAIVRFNTDGSLDSGFGSGGKVMYDATTSCYGMAVALVGTQILVGGGIWDTARGGDDFALWRYNGNGAIDSNFGSAGLAQSPGPSTNADWDITSLAIQGDGKIVGSGSALVRFNADGSPDTTFGTNGLVVTSPDWIYKFGLQADGKIVGAGWVPGGNTSTFLVRRWLAAASTTVPGAPTSVVATAGSGQATVSWTAPASNGGSAISGYDVTRYAGGVAQGTTSVGVVTQTTVTGLTNGTTYTFKVAAKNAVGTGPLSAESNAVTPTGGGGGGGPSSQQIAAAIAGQIAPRGAGARTGRLLALGYYRLKFAAPVAGSALIDWFYVPSGARVPTAVGAAKPKPVLVASGRRSFAAAGTGTIKVTLSAAGRKLLRHKKVLPITGRATFTPTGKSAVKATKRFTLRP